jgi:Domain of unknown function (DUF3520)/von Willebrand factor
MNLDDPKLTAYALGELSPAEESSMRQMVAGSPKAQNYVREVQDLADILRGEFRAELKAAALKPSNILPLPAPLSFWSDARWMSIGLAALLAICTVIAAVVLSGPDSRWATRSDRPRTSTHGTDLQMMVEDDVNTGTATPSRGRFAESISATAGEESGESGFVSAATNPRSTFTLNVGTASYGEVKRAIEQGKLPAKETVRIEEMVNYFVYDDPPPEKGGAFSINLEIAGCPWQAGHRLARIGVRRGDVAAREAGVQVEFNSAVVARYRLIGFERRSLASGQLPNEAGNSGEAGTPAVTALYEIIPAASGTPASSSELLTAILRYTPANGVADQVIKRALTDAGTTFEGASADFKFAAAVAEFGMILRESDHRGDGSFANVLDWANAGRGRDAGGVREGFIRLVQEAQRIAL